VSAPTIWGALLGEPRPDQASSRQPTDDVITRGPFRCSWIPITLYRIDLDRVLPAVAPCAECPRGWSAAEGAARHYSKGAEADMKPNGAMINARSTLRVPFFCSS